MIEPVRSELAGALLSIIDASEQPGNATLYNVVRHVANDPRFARAKLKGLARRGSPLIEELEVGTRAYNCLKRSGFETVTEVRACPDQHLLAIPNLGLDTLRQIREACEAVE